ncbi:MAG: DUF3592 domain-containing protein [Burkholderiales bacterium]|nr:DUF3592 domain-containing protein [Burkholderiales bacterium]
MHIFFGLAGWACLAGAGWLGWRRWRVQFSGVEAIGRVVALERREIDGNVSYHPTIEFHDANGTQRRFTSNGGSSAPSPAVGTDLTVRYLPSQPERAYIPGFFFMWSAPLALTLLGLGSLYAAWH